MFGHPLCVLEFHCQVPFFLVRSCFPLQPLDPAHFWFLDVGFMVRARTTPNVRNSGDFLAHRLAKTLPISFYRTEDEGCQG